MIGKMIDPRITISQIVNPPRPYGISEEDLMIAVAAIIVLLITDIVQEKIRIRETLSKKSTALRWTIIFAGLFAVLILGVYGPGTGASSFIYEQF